MICLFILCVWIGLTCVVIQNYAHMSQKCHVMWSLRWRLCVCLHSSAGISPVPSSHHLSFKKNGVRLIQSTGLNLLCSKIRWVDHDFCIDGAPDSTLVLHFCVNLGLSTNKHLLL
jgi:hypothetical protein